jgi:hypothetical protein
MTHMALIRKAAHGRDLKLIGRSVVFNRSAEALQRIGESVLPEIEEFLSKEFRSDLPVDAMEGQPWLGLVNLFGVYLEVAADSNYSNLPDFLLSLHGWLREEAIRNIYMIWGRTNARGEQPLPGGLLRVIQRVGISGSKLERDFANRLLRHQKDRKQSSRRGLVTAKK